MRETKETVANPSSQSHEVPSPENSAKFQDNFTKDKEAKLLYKLLTSESNGIYIKKIMFKQYFYPNNAKQFVIRKSISVICHTKRLKKKKMTFSGDTEPST